MTKPKRSKRRRSRRSSSSKASGNLTWRALVREAVSKLGGEVSLPALYAALDGHAKTKANPRHWKAKVRQTLQQDPIMESAGRGRWRLKRPEGT